MQVKTFPLFGAVYMTDKALAAAKTHACEVDAEGFPIRVLCGRISLDSVCADLVVADDSEPTCKACAAKRRKI